DGKPTLRMKLNAPTVPPTPPVPSLATEYPLGASHRGHDTLDWTGSLLFKKSPRHNGRGACLRQRSRLIRGANTPSHNYGNVDIGLDLLHHPGFNRLLHSANCAKLYTSYPHTLSGQPL